MPSLASTPGDRASGIDGVIHRHCAATPGIEGAVLLSAGGLVLCADATTARADTERLAALSSSLMSLARAAARAYGSSWVGATVVTMERHHLCLVPVDPQTSVAVLADSGTDTSQISYVAAVMAAEIFPLLDGDTRTRLGRFFLQPG